MSSLRVLTVVCCFALLLSCSQEAARQNESAADSAHATVNDSAQLARIQKIFYSLPSPLQVASLLRQAGTTFTENQLSPASHASRYTTNYSRALNLGIYCTDLAYANVYNQSQAAITYLDAIKKVSDGLGMSSVFETEEIYVRFKNNTSNQDSLFIIIADLFRESDQFLKENEKLNLAALVLAGGWVEGVYLATLQTKNGGNSQITDRIAEQKLSLAHLTSLLSEFKSDTEFADLINDLNDLQKSYVGVSIEHSSKETTTDEATQTTTIRSTNKISFSPNSLKEIAAKTAAIRNKIINL